MYFGHKKILCLSLYFYSLFKYCIPPARNLLLECVCIYSLLEPRIKFENDSTDLFLYPTLLVVRGIFSLCGHM